MKNGDLIVSKITHHDYRVQQICGSQVIVETPNGGHINLDIEQVKVVKGAKRG